MDCPDLSLHEISFKIRRMRAELKMTQKAFAAHVGVRPYVIANLEIGEIPHVRLKRLAGLAAFLNVPVEKLNPDATELRVGAKRGGRWPKPKTQSTTSHSDEVEEEIALYNRPEHRGDCLTSVQRHKLAVKRAGLLGTQAPKPDVRGGDGIPDGTNCARPCPWVSCKHHMFVDVNQTTGGMKVNFPEFDVWDMASMSAAEISALNDEQLAELVELRGWSSLIPSCSLDMADAGPVVLERVGVFLNVTRERARQLEATGMAKLRAWARVDGAFLREFLTGSPESLTAGGVAFDYSLW